MPPSATISASTRVDLPPEETFRILADLDRHHALTDGGMTILKLDGPPGARTGGLVELHGPLGVRRRARTRVEGAEHPSRLWGRAAIASGTEAAIEWRLEPVPDGTGVEVRLSVEPATRFDRLLLALGAGLWLRRRLRAGVVRLRRIPGSE